MAGMSRVGDAIQGGLHCHGHDHGPQPSPGCVTQGSSRVFVRGLPAARDMDEGHSPACCGGVGRIVLGAAQALVFIEGRGAIGRGAPTVHCEMAPGVVQGGCDDVRIP